MSLISKRINGKTPKESALEATNGARSLLPIISAIFEIAGVNKNPIPLKFVS
jgi:hypothetical protein